MESDAIVARLSAVYAELPPGERAVVRVLLDDHPFAALGSLRALAERAGVSPPTASRLFDRLGYAGFADFQTAVRDGARDRSRLLEYVTRPEDEPPGRAGRGGRGAARRPRRHPGRRPRPALPSRRGSAGRGQDRLGARRAAERAGRRLPHPPARGPAPRRAPGARAGPRARTYRARPGRGRPGRGLRLPPLLPPPPPVSCGPRAVAARG
ncbi:hypothetical protein [Nonomuraea salmonea]|uniref:MurR/RpiR family transcriptional regulator n=1 Tax=Nonomuraea salmonea TaxID=46181 RepID=UPI0031E58482